MKNKALQKRLPEEVGKEERFSKQREQQAKGTEAEKTQLASRRKD